MSGDGDQGQRSEGSVDRAVRESIALARSARMARFESVFHRPLHEVMKAVATAQGSDLHVWRPMKDRILP